MTWRWLALLVLVAAAPVGAAHAGKIRIVRDALRSTDCKSVVGPINFSNGPFPNTCLTPLVAGQWRKGSKWPLELVIVDNTGAPDIPLGGHPEPMTYGS